MVRTYTMKDSSNQQIIAPNDVVMHFGQHTDTQEMKRATTPTHAPVSFGDQSILFVLTAGGWAGVLSTGGGGIRGSLVILLSPHQLQMVLTEAQSLKEGIK